MQLYIIPEQFSCVEHSLISMFWSSSQPFEQFLNWNLTLHRPKQRLQFDHFKKASPILFSPEKKKKILKSQYKSGTNLEQFQTITCSDKNFLGSLWFDFPYYSARYVEEECDIYWDKEKTKTILPSLQACFVITHSSGDFIVILLIKIPRWVSNHEAGL